MSKPQTIHTALGSIYVLFTNERLQPILIAAAAIPTDNDDGYAAGCLMIKLGAASLDDALFINIGDENNCNFDAMQSA